MTPVSADIAVLVDREAMLLDERRFDEWLNMLADDVWYWIPLVPEQRDPLDGPSHLYETRDALLARVYRLKDPQNLPQQPPSRCCRIMGRAFRVSEAARPAEIVVRARFQLIEALPHDDAGGLRHFAGTITYGLTGAGDALRIRWRRVDLINSEKGLLGVSILI